MSLTAVPNDGLEVLQDIATGKSAYGSYEIRLFVNDLSGSWASHAGFTTATFTEMSTHGYVALPVNDFDWTVSSNGSTSTGTFVFTFTADTPVTVYGFFLVDMTTLKTVYAEQFTSPPVVQNNGDTIQFALSMDFVEA